MNLASVREGRCPSCGSALEVEKDETCPSLGWFGRCPKCRSCWQAEGERIWNVYPKDQLVNITIDGFSFDTNYLKIGRPADQASPAHRRSTNA